VDYHQLIIIEKLVDVNPLRLSVQLRRIMVVVVDRESLDVISKVPLVQAPIVQLQQEALLIQHVEDLEEQVDLSDNL
jgi:hypothetical protein